jgi:hypothetical protein
MTFKENLLKKIRIDTLAKTVIDSWGPPESIQHIDKEAMRRLLELAEYRLHRERDLELYLEPTTPAPSTIVVLDNELAVYRSTVADVALRKSPTVKEMISIRNAIKILNDADVLVSKKQASVQAIQKAAVAGLDLSFTASDIAKMAADGTSALAHGDSEKVLEALVLFSELLGFGPPPRALATAHGTVFGTRGRSPAGDLCFGPGVFWDPIDNLVALIDKPVNVKDKDQVAWARQVLQRKTAAPIEGKAVFEVLYRMVLKAHPAGSG